MPELGEPSGLEFLSKSEEKSEGDEAVPDGDSDSCDEQQSDKEIPDEMEAPDICEESDKLTDDIASVVLSDRSALPEEPKEKVDEDERSPQEVMDELLERAFLQG